MGRPARGLTGLVILGRSLESCNPARIGLAGHFPAENNWRTNGCTPVQQTPGRNRLMPSCHGPRNRELNGTRLACQRGQEMLSKMPGQLRLLPGGTNAAGRGQPGNPAPPPLSIRLCHCLLLSQPSGLQDMQVSPLSPLGREGVQCLLKSCHPQELKEHSLARGVGLGADSAPPLCPLLHPTSLAAQCPPARS